MSVYLATGPRIDHIKVGYWNGTHNALYHRYKTYYGPDLLLYVYACPEPARYETIFKRNFVDKNVALELFDKSNFEEYIEFFNRQFECGYILLTGPLPDRSVIPLVPQRPQRPQRSITRDERFADILPNIDNVCEVLGLTAADDTLNTFTTEDIFDNMTILEEELNVIQDAMKFRVQSAQKELCLSKVRSMLKAFFLSWSGMNLEFVSEIRTPKSRNATYRLRPKDSN
jgi:hypothetical protein